MTASYDIAVYDTKNDDWAEARYLVHGFDEVLWTDDLSEAINYLRESVLLFEKNELVEQLDKLGYNTKYATYEELLKMKQADDDFKREAIRRKQ
jgi:hypothetical protein